MANVLVPDDSVVLGWANEKRGAFGGLPEIDFLFECIQLVDVKGKHDRLVKPHLRLDRIFRIRQKFLGQRRSEVDQLDAHLEMEMAVFIQVVLAGGLPANMLVE